MYLREGRGGVAAPAAGVARAGRTFYFERCCRSGPATGAPLATACITRATAQLRAPGEGEAVRLRLLAAWAATAAATVVVAPSVGKADGAGTAEEEGWHFGGGRHVAGAAGSTRGETAATTCVGGRADEYRAYMDAGQEPNL
jgi:hypothetical protein